MAFAPLHFYICSHILNDTRITNDISVLFFIMLDTWYLVGMSLNITLIKDRVIFKCQYEGWEWGAYATPRPQVIALCNF